MIEALKSEYVTVGNQKYKIIVFNEVQHLNSVI